MNYDTVLKGGQVLDVETGTLRVADIAFANGLVAALADAPSELTGTAEIDVSGRILVPGFIDAHLHIESSMLVPAEFAKSAAAHGTTAAFVDPHEIANVAGADGVSYFLDQAERLPLDLYVGIPSCVPATPLENAGGRIGLSDIDRFLDHPRVYGLAEMMNFPGIVHGMGDARAEVTMAHEAGKIVDGHAPGLLGDELNTYITNGERDGIVRIMSDHECTWLDEAVEKRRAGMTIALRYGTASKDLDRILPELWDRMDGDLSGFMLCSDDISAAELLRDGHMDRTVRRTRDLLQASAGLDPTTATIEALRLATRNPGAYFARFFRTQNLPPMGTLAEGARANAVVLDSLETLAVRHVFCGGARVDERNAEPTPPPVPTVLRSSVQLPHPPTANDFRIEIEPTPGQETATLRVIEFEPGSLLTGQSVAEFAIGDGGIAADPTRDLAKIAVLERHGGPGTRAVGFVRGLGLKTGALASTVAHDSHNLVVAGVEDEALVAACDALRQCGGGFAVAVDDDVQVLPLEVGGLMADRSIATVVREFDELLAAAQSTGTALENPFMALSFLSLPVIPELKITDRGLVDVGRFDFVPLQA